MGFAEKFLDFFILWIDIGTKSTMQRNWRIWHEFIFKKRRTVRVKTQNGKSFDGKRSFLYVLARTKEQHIERMQVICQRNRPHGTCLLSMADLFSEWHHSILRAWKSPWQQTIPWHPSIRPALIHFMDIGIIHYSSSKGRSRYKNTRYKDIPSLISGDIRCEVRNGGSHNGKCPSKSGCKSHSRLFVYYSIFLWNSLRIPSQSDQGSISWQIAFLS